MATTSLLVGVTEAWAETPITHSSFWQVTKVLRVGVFIWKWTQKSIPVRVTVKHSVTYGWRHKDSSMVSTEETVAGDRDRCSEFFIEGKLLAVGPLTSHLTFFNFGFLTSNRRTLSTPGEFWRSLTEEALTKALLWKLEIQFVNTCKVLHCAQCLT